MCRMQRSTARNAAFDTIPETWAPKQKSILNDLI